MDYELPLYTRISVTFCGAISQESWKLIIEGYEEPPKMVASHPAPEEKQSSNFLGDAIPNKGYVQNIFFCLTMKLQGNMMEEIVGK